MTAFEYLCKIRCLQIKQIATEVEVSPQQANDWVKGRRPIPKKRLETVSKVTSIPIDLLKKTQLENEDKAQILKMEVERLLA